MKKTENLNKAPKDPSDENRYYKYGTTVDYKKYQVTTTLENGEETTYIVDWAYAWISEARVEWTYTSEDIYRYDATNNEIVVVPSLLFNGSWTKDLWNTSIYYVVDEWKNLPYTVWTETQNAQTVVDTIKVVTKRDNITTNKVDLTTAMSSVDGLANALTGIVWKKEDIINIIKTVNEVENKNFDTATITTTVNSLSLVITLYVASSNS